MNEKYSKKNYSYFEIYCDSPEKISTVQPSQSFQLMAFI